MLTLVNKEMKTVFLYIAPDAVIFDKKYLFWEYAFLAN